MTRDPSQTNRRSPMTSHRTGRSLRCFGEDRLFHLDRSWSRGLPDRVAIAELVARSRDVRKYRSTGEIVLTDPRADHEGLMSEPFDRIVLAGVRARGIGKKCPGWVGGFPPARTIGHSSGRSSRAVTSRRKISEREASAIIVRAGWVPTRTGNPTRRWFSVSDESARTSRDETVQDNQPRNLRRFETVRRGEWPRT